MSVSYSVFWVFFKLTYMFKLTKTYVSLKFYKCNPFISLKIFLTLLMSNISSHYGFGPSSNMSKSFKGSEYDRIYKTKKCKPDSVD